MEAPEQELREGALVTPTLRLVSRLGGGGMGSVWTADHLGLDTRVAVKFIAHSLAGDAASAARFRREAAAAAQVKSPHVVQVLDYGVSSAGTPYIVMELLEGRDLRARISAGAPMPARETVSIIRQVARALGRAHDEGIIHRDVKPENVFLCRSDDDEPFVKVLDFGVAKRESAPDLTTTGTTVGTPYYMSPEQLVGSKAIDARSDIWSVGVMTFFMLTGKRPFNGETAAAIAVAVHHERLPRPSDVNRALPGSVDLWFSRACARDPLGRFASVKELATSLGDALNCTQPGPFEAITTMPVRLSQMPLEGDATMPASMRGVVATASSREAARQAPTMQAAAASSSTLSASTGSATPTTRGNRTSWVAWGIAFLAVATLGVFVVRTQLGGSDAPRSPASSSASAGQETKTVDTNADKTDDTGDGVKGTETATTKVQPVATASAAPSTSATTMKGMPTSKSTVGMPVPKTSAPPLKPWASPSGKSQTPTSTDELPDLK